MYNALQSIQAFEAGTGARKERERETAMKGIGNALAANDWSGASAQAFQLDPFLGMQVRGYGDQQNALATQKKIGGLVASGDMTGASNMAAEDGNFELMQQLQQFARTATVQQREDALFGADVMAKTFMGYEGMTPDEITQRWAVDGPRLQQQFGIDPAMMSQINPADPRQRAQAILEAQTMSEILAGKRWQQTFDAGREDAAQAQNNWQTAFNRGVYEFDTTREDALAAAEAEAAADEGPNVDDEGQFRREFNTVTKEFRDVQAAYGRIKATDATTPAGQLSLVFQYMKMLDPGSTVREGEYANAENARGVPSGVLNMYNAIIEGKRLTPGQIGDFKSQAQKLYTESLSAYDATAKTYTGIAEGYGFDPGRTVPDLGLYRGDEMNITDMSDEDLKRALGIE